MARRCESAATIVLAAASHRRADLGASFLLHSAEVTPPGRARWTAGRHQARAKALQDADRQMVDILVRATGAPADRLKAELATERPLDAFAALRLDNVIKGAWHGIFVESGSRVTVAHNRVTDILEGYSGCYVNTATSFAEDVKVVGNYFEGKEDERGLAGFYCKLASRVHIAGNTFKRISHGLYFTNGASDVDVGVNDFNDIEVYVVYLARFVNPSTGQIVYALTRSNVDQQRYHGELVSGWPKACYPEDEPNGGVQRYFRVRMAGVLGLYDRAMLSTNIYHAEGRTLYAAGAGGAPVWNTYAIYSGGETIVYLDPAGALPLVGESVRVGEYYFKIHARSGGQCAIRSASDVAGDYTAFANLSSSVFIYTNVEIVRVATH